MKQAMGPRAADVAGRGTLWLFAARLFFMGAGLVISVLLARGLGPGEFGLYGLAISLLTWTQLLVNWAIPGAVARLAPAHGHDPRIAGTGTTLLLAAAALLYGLVWFAAPLLERLAGMAGVSGVVRLLFLDLWLLAGHAALQAVFLAHGRLGGIAALLALQSGIKLVAIVLLLALGLDIWRVVLAHLAGTSVALALVAWRQPFPRPAFSPGFARALLAGSLPLLTYAMVYQFQANVGVWWVAAVRTAGEIDAPGHFTAAMQLARLLTLVPSVLSGVLFARVADAVARGEPREAADQLAVALRYALMLLLPALAAFTAAADAMVALLFGPAYGEAAAMLRWLALAGTAMALLDVLLHALMGAGWLWSGPLIAALVVPLALMAGTFAIPALGAGGVPAALAAGALGALAVALLTVARRMHIPLRLASLLRLALASGALYAVLSIWTVPPWWLILQFALLAGAYFALLWLLGELDGRDLALLHPTAATPGPRP